MFHHRDKERVLVRFRYHILLLLAAAIPLFANSDYIIKDFGIKSGISMANQEFDVDESSLLYTLIKGADFKYRPGFTAGFFVDWFNERYINLVTELNFTQNGTIYNTGGVTYKEFDNRLDYLYVSALAKLRYPDIWFLPYLLFGIRYDFLLNLSTESDVVLYDDAKMGNMGITLGLGYEFIAGGFPVLLEYSYHNQYANLLEDEDHHYTARNFSHNLVLGYRFKGMRSQSPEDQTETLREKELSRFREVLMQEDIVADPATETKKQQKGEQPAGFTKTDLASRALILPGFAHFSTGRHISGSVYSALFAGAVGLSFYRVYNYNNKVEQWQSEVNKITPTTLFYDTERIQQRSNELKAETEKYRKRVYFSFTGLAAIYFANVIDAVVFAPEDQMKVRVTVNPEFLKQDLEISLTLEF